MTSLFKIQSKNAVTVWEGDEDDLNLTRHYVNNEIVAAINYDCPKISLVKILYSKGIGFTSIHNLKKI